MWRYVGMVSVLLVISCAAVDSDSPEHPEAALFAGLDLQPVQSPAEEDVDDTLYRRFSHDEALQRLDQIQSALGSFRELTSLAEPVIPAEKLADIGNVVWDTQYLGFVNWAGAVRGTIHKQHYLIARLQYDLALKRLEDGEITAAQAETARQEYEQANQAFLDFWNDFCIAD